MVPAVGAEEPAAVVNEDDDDESGSDDTTDAVEEVEPVDQQVAMAPTGNNIVESLVAEHGGGRSSRNCA